MRHLQWGRLQTVGLLSGPCCHFDERLLLACRQSCSLRHRVPVSLLREAAGACACSPFTPKPPPLSHSRDQVVERMVEFVVKGQEFRGRWFNLLPRVAVVSVTVLNAANIVFMAVFSYFSSKGWLSTRSFVFILFN